jgi:hypothetical protein
MTVSAAITLLELAISEPGKRAEYVRRFQDAVFQDDSLEGPVGGILRDLAYDLDFYQPDPHQRDEDAALFDDAHAVGEIERALQRIRVLLKP